MAYMSSVKSREGSSGYLIILWCLPCHGALDRSWCRGLTENWHYHVFPRSLPCQAHRSLRSCSCPLLLWSPLQKVREYSECSLEDKADDSAGWSPSEEQQWSKGPLSTLTLYVGFHWFSTFQMLSPFNTILRAVATPIIKLFSLLRHNFVILLLLWSEV